MGLLAPSDWQARWIGPPDAGTASAPEAVPMVRRAFNSRGEVRRARAYVTSHGLYQLFLNGQRVGDAELTPGWTSYNKRLQYQTYDVTWREHCSATGGFAVSSASRGIAITMGIAWRCCCRSRSRIETAPNVS